MKTTLEISQQIKIAQLQAELSAAKNSPVVVTDDMIENLSPTTTYSEWLPRLRVVGNHSYDVVYGVDQFAVMYSTDPRGAERAITLYADAKTVFTKEALCSALDKMLEQVKHDFVRKVTGI